MSGWKNVPPRSYIPRGETRSTSEGGFVIHARAFFCAVTILSLVPVAAPHALAGKTVLGDYPLLRQVGFSNVVLRSVTPGSGHIGLDVWSLHRSLNGGTLYNACHNSDDPDYGVCVNADHGPTSYYRVYHYSPAGHDFQHGMFIDNSGPNRCRKSNWCRNKGAETLTPLAANRVAGAAVEIYPHGSRGYYDPNDRGAYGGVRIQVDEFARLANGGAYSADLGTVALSRLSDPGMAKLNGYVYDGGKPLSTPDTARVRVDLFQQGRAPHVTSTGHPVRGFASVWNDGWAYYNGGPVYAGRYDVYVWDMKTGRVIMLQATIARTDERLDFELDKPCFGLASCVTLR